MDLKTGIWMPLMVRSKSPMLGKPLTGNANTMSPHAPAHRVIPNAQYFASYTPTFTPTFISKRHAFSPIATPNLTLPRRGQRRIFPYRAREYAILFPQPWQKRLHIGHPKTTGANGLGSQSHLHALPLLQVPRLHTIPFHLLMAECARATADAEARFDKPAFVIHARHPR